MLLLSREARNVWAISRNLRLPRWEVLGVDRNSPTGRVAGPESSLAWSSDGSIELRHAPQGVPVVRDNATCNGQLAPPPFPWR